MGTATATSSFVDKPLTGNVYAVEQAGVAFLPGLVADLRGRVNAKIKIATQIINGKYIRSTVTDVPDLPVSSFSMSLIGGDKGPLESKFDLCFKSREQVPDDEPGGHLHRAQRQAHHLEAAARSQRLRARRHRVAARRRQAPGDAEADGGATPGRRRTSRA